MALTSGYAARIAIALTGLLTLAACELPGKYTKTGESVIIVEGRPYTISEFRQAFTDDGPLRGQTSDVFFSVKVDGANQRCAEASEASCAVTVRKLIADAQRGMGY